MSVCQVFEGFSGRGERIRPVEDGLDGRILGRALMDSAGDSLPFLELNVFEANSAACRFYGAYRLKFVNRHISEASGHPEIRFRFEEGRPQGEEPG